MFLMCRLTRGAFTIDSSTPTLRRNLNEHPIHVRKLIFRILQQTKPSYNMPEIASKPHQNISHSNNIQKVSLKHLFRIRS
jgi:hypothetical protein